jgi:hypothetical protein
MGGLGLAVVVNRNLCVQTSTLILQYLQLCVPDWPYFNKNKVQWLEELPDRSEDNDAKPAAKVKSKKARKD